METQERGRDGREKRHGRRKLREGKRRREEAVLVTWGKRGVEWQKERRKRRREERSLWRPGKEEGTEESRETAEGN